MDLEAELIKSGQWEELRRHYSGQVGHSWELAWVSLLQFQNRADAARSFRLSQRDPHFETASRIMLWRLEGQIPPGLSLSEMPSLRLYEAFERGRVRPWLNYFRQVEDSSALIPQLLARAEELSTPVTQEELVALQNLTALTPESNYFLCQFWSRRFRNKSEAFNRFQQFAKDPISHKILSESEKYLVDQDMKRRVQHALAHKDGLMLQRLYPALKAKLDKIPKDQIPESWKQAFGQALEIEIQSITENIVSFEFWHLSCWSPKALMEIRKQIFPLDRGVRLEFLRRWEEFFHDEPMSAPSEDLDPDSLPLWQIRVELNPSHLSSALLKFPTEERFLFLWSLRNQKSLRKKDDRRWPSDAKESRVVSENLKRAFERSSNRLLWFDRLRKVGCSQDFYEYVLSRIDLPLNWILDDLDHNFLRNSTLVRQAIADRVAVAAQNEADHGGISDANLKRALSQLTPSEKQAALLSRFVLAEIPPALIDDEVLDLLWEALPRVSESVAEAWRLSIVEHLKKKRLEKFGLRHWRWVYLSWEKDEKALETFSPNFDPQANFPWTGYLEAAEKHSRTDLILTCLLPLRNERLKVEWIERFLSESVEDLRLEKAIKSLSSPGSRWGLLGRYYENRQRFDKAFEAYRNQLDEVAVINEQAQVIRDIFRSFSQLKAADQSRELSHLSGWTERLQALGQASSEFLSEVARAFARHQRHEEAWNWLLQSWLLSNDAEKEECLGELLEFAFQAKRVDEVRRLLVDMLFLYTRPQALTRQILDELLRPTSVFRLKHWRQEFVAKIGSLYPLREEVLRKRAAYDYRAVLLWDCFYRKPLDETAGPDEMGRKRRFELWKMTEALTHRESFQVFASMVQPQWGREIPISEPHEFLDSAKRILNRTLKQFRIKQKPEIVLVAEQSSAFVMSFEPAVLSVDRDFFNDLDEEIWSAISSGYAQCFSDWNKGLFEEKSLIERFFQGLLLSGSSIRKITQLCLWLGLFEKILEATDLEANPEELSQKLPLLSQLLSLYLSADYARKVEESGIPLR